MERRRIQFARELLHGIRRDRVRLHIFALGQRRRIAVRRRRGGIHDAADARFARGEQHVQRSVDVRAMARDRIGDRFRHRRNCGLVQDAIRRRCRIRVQSARNRSRSTSSNSIASEQPSRFSRLPVLKLSSARTRSPRSSKRPHESGTDESGGAGDQIGRHISRGLYRQRVARDQCRTGPQLRTDWPRPGPVPREGSYG